MMQRVVCVIRTTMYVIDPTGEREEGGGVAVGDCRCELQTDGRRRECGGKRERERSGASHAYAGRGDVEARSQTNKKPIEPKSK